MNKFNSKQTALRVAAFVAMASPLAARAAGEAPLDMSATGTTIAGYVALAATAGLLVFAPKAAIRVIISAWKMVANRG